MCDVTQILQQMEVGDASVAERLLPLVYDELKRLARERLKSQSPGQTLQPTALVHEAYVRLVNQKQAQKWNSRGHFFVAATEAMRRILIESIRRKQSLKRGGHLRRSDLDVADLISPQRSRQILALDAALSELQTVDPQCARLVELRFFSGLTNVQAAEVINVSPRTAKRLWAYARAWLRDAMDAQTPDEEANSGIL